MDDWVGCRCQVPGRATQLRDVSPQCCCCKHAWLTSDVMVDVCVFQFPQPVSVQHRGSGPAVVVDQGCVWRLVTAAGSGTHHTQACTACYSERTMTSLHRVHRVCAQVKSATAVDTVTVSNATDYVAAAADVFGDDSLEASAARFELATAAKREGNTALALEVGQRGMASAVLPCGHGFVVSRHGVSQLCSHFRGTSSSLTMLLLAHCTCVRRRARAFPQAWNSPPYTTSCGDACV